MKLLFVVSMVLCSCATLIAPKPMHQDEGTRFALASQGEGTSAAGKEMLDLGGNVVDAFAAMSFAISVERPHSTGLGGGGFLLLQMADWAEPRAFDFRERAPIAAYETMFLDEKGEVVPRRSVIGPLAAGTPGLVRGVLELQRKYGKLTRKEVMAPAIRLAEGFKIYPELAKALQYGAPTLAGYPSSAAIFLAADGKTPKKEGEMLVQADLAKTLRAISELGEDEFYRGEIGRLLIASQRKWGGLMRAQDLRDYKLLERKPVALDYKGYRIFSMPPPSSGGVHVIQMLEMLKNDDLKALGFLSPASVHLMSSAMELAFRDRAAFLGDPDFQKVPTKGLQDPRYVKSLREKIPADKALDAAKLGPGNPWPYESPETTHFSILDKDGNAVSTTQTINGYFGAGLVAEGTGILFNNEMDDFGAKVGAKNIFNAVGGEKNLVQPGKRPLSSMAPTIADKDGKAVLALGSPSGTRIINCVFQSVANYLTFGKPLGEAIGAPRFHHQWFPDVLYVEKEFPLATRAALEKMGHKVEEKDLGCRVGAAAREGTVLKAVADPRGFGSGIAE